MNNANAIKLSAALPMLGSFEVLFYEESAEILRGFGEKKELARLRKIPHLGIAGLTLTGVNHSRLEYTLLQSAIISMVAKLFKNEAALAISSKVKFCGKYTMASSGEEVLKSWALLGNFGHLQYTYAEERAYLIAARKEKKILNWLVDSSQDENIRKWIFRVIEEGRDELMP